MTHLLVDQTPFGCTKETKRTNTVKFCILSTQFVANFSIKVASKKSGRFILGLHLDS